MKNKELGKILNDRLSNKLGYLDSQKRRYKRNKISLNRTSSY